LALERTKTWRIAMAAKYVYFFGNGKAEGTAEMKSLLGGRG
jgi:pyruvate,orthophosphate dikinase